MKTICHLLPSVVLGLLSLACQKNVPPPPTPKLLPQIIKLEPSQLSSSGLLSRDLYRSFWVLPSKDEDPIHIGLIPSSKKIEVSSEHSFRIRVHQEHKSWDIVSPPGMSWTIEFSKRLRPKMVRYFATIEHRMLKPGQHLENNLLLPWIDTGFKKTQWVGPPKMDARNTKSQITRHFLALDVFSQKQQAEEFCQRFEAGHSQACTVVGRMDLPALGRGILRGFDGRFSESFTGLLEMIPSPTIDLHHVPTKLLSDDKKSLTIRDSLFVIPNAQNELTVVEVLSLKDYLSGVIPTEIFPNAPLEALKAQAIIARTYTLSQLWSRYALEPFYTCVTTRCQAYHGRKKIHKNVLRSIQETKNLVLKNSDEPFDFTQTFYHASSGGITDDSDIIFGTQTFYPGATVDLLSHHRLDLKQTLNVRKLIDQGIPTYCAQNSFSKGHEKWHKKLSSKTLKQMLGQSIKDIRVLKRGVSGRAIKLRIVFASSEKIIHGELNIRKAFGGLPSSLFYMIKKQNHQGLSQVSFVGRGRGHGVGLSQLGAIGRAQAGQNMRKILNAYYPTTILKPIL